MNALKAHIFKLAEMDKEWEDIKWAARNHKRKLKRKAKKK